MVGILAQQFLEPPLRIRMISGAAGVPSLRQSGTVGIERLREAEGGCGRLKFAEIDEDIAQGQPGRRQRRSDPENLAHFLERRRRAPRRMIGARQVPACAHESRRGIDHTLQRFDRRRNLTAAQRRQRTPVHHVKW